MPGTEEAAQGDAGAEQSVEELLGLAGEPGGANEPATPTRPATRQQPGGEFEVAGRKWTSRGEFEKSYRSLLGEFSKGQSKVKSLERLLQDPDIAARIADDPEIADALRKAGVELREEEIRRSGEETPNPQDAIDENSVDFRMARMEFREQFREERREIEAELKRPLADEERSAMRRIMSDIPRLSLRQAYLLATADKRMKDAYEKGRQEGSPRGRRPPPIPGVLPGQPVNTKKPVTEMSKGEFREHMREAVRETGEV